MMELREKPPRNQKRREMLSALTVSVVVGLVPGLVFARQMATGRLSPSDVWGALCGALTVPGLMLTPLPHMGPYTLVVAIPVNILFYFGATWVIIRFLHWYAESPHE